jgi:hypothetical protein
MIVVDVCVLCGASVALKEVHEKFHAGIEEMARMLVQEREVQ